MAAFLSELHLIAKFCNFGDSFDTMLGDRLVCGINDDRIQQKVVVRGLRGDEIDPQISSEAGTSNKSRSQGLRRAQTTSITAKNTKIDKKRVIEQKAMLSLCESGTHTRQMSIQERDMSSVPQSRAHRMSL